MSNSTRIFLRLAIFSLLFILTAKPLRLEAQTAYYDAQALTALLDSPTISHSDYDLLKDLLRKYGLLDPSRVSNDPIDTMNSHEDTVVLKDLIKNSPNTFFTNSTATLHIVAPAAAGSSLLFGDFIDIAQFSSAKAKLAKALSAPPSSTPTSGNLTAMIIEGIGKFLANRTKEELTVAFFQKFKTFLNTNPEIGTLFPTTIKFLNGILSTSSPNMLSTLREAFVSDIKNILGDIAAVAALNPTSSCSLCTNDKRKSKCADRLTHIQAIFKTEFGRLLVAGLIIADGAINEKNPADILSTVVNNNAIHSLGDIYNSLELMNIFSKALRSSEPTEIWLPVADIKSMLGDVTFRNNFLGFVYSQVDSEKIVIAGKKISTYFTVGNANGAVTYVTNLINAANSLESSFQALVKPAKSAGSDSNVESVLDHSKQFVSSLSQFLAQAMKYTTINSSLPTPSKTIVNILNYTDSAMNVVGNILNKNYYAAFLSLDILVQNITGVNLNAFTPSGKVKEKYQLVNDTLHNSTAFASNKEVRTAIKDLADTGAGAAYNPDSSAKLSNLYNNSTDVALDKKTFVSNLLRYGTFMADVVTASDVDGVESAIEAIALPPGSSSIKKNTNVSISIQSYVGLGISHIPGSNPYYQNFGVSAPIGVSFNFGLRSWFWPKFFTKVNPVNTSTWGSLSVFIPLVDLGAVVSYEFTNPSSQPSNTTNVTWGNIFAPGVNLVYGIPGVPLSIGFGPEYQSALKTLSKSGITLNNNPGLRWNVFLAVDIPLVNVYVSKN
jgi:hypothetical protein